MAIVVLLIALVKVGNVLTIAGPLLDIPLFLCLAHLVYCTSRHANARITGLRKYLPGCHDIQNKINSFCSRHNGLHWGFAVFFALFVIFDSWVVELICTWNDALLFGPGLAVLLFGLPVHGILTKGGMKSSDKIKFISAVIWALTFFASAYYYYYSFAHPC